MAEGEFKQTAKLSTSYLDEDILILDNIKVLADPDPVRLQMNMIAACQEGYLQLEIAGKEIHLGKNDIFVCPPETIINVVKSSDDFVGVAMCFTNRGMQNILRSHINVWNRAMYVEKVSIVKMTETDMLFYAKFTDLVRLCLNPDYSQLKSWNPYRREIVETLLKSALLALCNVFSSDVAVDIKSTSTTYDIFDRFLALLQQSEVKHQPVEYFAHQLCITPKYLSIVCKRHSGKTAIEWITEYTLSDITYYLRSTNKSIKEISGLLGFSNTSFFGKYVREHLHTSPMKYRESLRK